MKTKVIKIYNECVKKTAWMDVNEYFQANGISIDTFFVASNAKAN